MKYITVLDHETGRVYQYDVGVFFKEEQDAAKFIKEPWSPDVESCEEYLTRKGHRLKDCEWMVHENPQIVID